MITKKLLLISSLFLLSVSVLSSEAPALGDIKYDEAVAVSVDGQSEALEQCNRHQDAYYRTHCLLIIENGVFEIEALLQCNRQQYLMYLNDCLAIIKNGTFQQEALLQCNRQLPLVYLNSCLGVIKNGAFQQEALLQCERHRHAIFINNCLMAIKDGTFEAETLRQCNLYQLSIELNSCLRRVRVVIEEPAKPTTLTLESYVGTYNQKGYFSHFTFDLNILDDDLIVFEGSIGGTFFFQCDREEMRCVPDLARNSQEEVCKGSSFELLKNGDIIINNPCKQKSSYYKKKTK